LQLRGKLGESPQKEDKKEKNSQSKVGKSIAVTA
jgi:hypothetical protein